MHNKQKFSDDAGDIMAFAIILLLCVFFAEDSKSVSKCPTHNVDNIPKSISANNFAHAGFVILKK